MIPPCHQAATNELQLGSVLPRLVSLDAKLQVASLGKDAESWKRLLEAVG